ncbi:MAG: biotin-dependent carboxyltransferase family protein [Lachnospiraceae bacterium]|jgi:antagonist of KipI|nr:biotin-dependent carboxyltransferase family protein [Lachnospiraceae bacterium]
MNIEVIRSGPLTTVQDRGRFGYLRSGLGPSGPMDRDAFEEAARAVGNENGEAGLEMTLFGATLKFGGPCTFVVTGADMGAKLDGTPVQRGVPVTAFAGQTLACGFAADGCRGYFAVRGGIDVPVVMNSRSTNLKCRLGGLDGRSLKDGDVLRVPDQAASGEQVSAGSTVASETGKQPVYGHSVTVRVIRGPQDDYFTAAGMATFLSSSYKVSVQSDRMGIRLEGPMIESRGGTDIVSDGIAFGSVQVPAGGQPIILMADRQTTGGYAKIATVVTADLPLLAQRKPGDEVHFTEVTVEEIQKEIRRKAAKPVSIFGILRGLFWE